MKMRKAIALSLAIMILVAASVMGTIAWLQDTTTPVTNTFTTGNVDITLKETATDFKMIPGKEITKDPKVTVVDGSEDCWLFVKVTEENKVADYVEYTIDSNWTELTTAAGTDYKVYYCEAVAGNSFSVLTGDKVTVKTGVSNTMMDTAETTQPKLTFQAYAIQKANIAAEGTKTVQQVAWETVQSAIVYGQT